MSQANFSRTGDGRPVGDVVTLWSYATCGTSI